MKYKILLILILTQTFSFVFASSNSFYNLLIEYELKMDEAAIAWMNKNYGRSLDNFKSAKDLLSRSAFASSKGFEWEGCKSLQTYTLVLARLAESDMYKNSGQNKLYNEVASQANVWADKLLLQGKSWYKIKTFDEKENHFRQKWLSRFRSVIMRSRKLKFE